MHPGFWGTCAWDATIPSLLRNFERSTESGASNTCRVRYRFFVIAGDFRDGPTGLSATCPIPQGDYQQHRDETGADPQGDIHDGLA